MHFSEIRGMILLTMLLTVGILIAQKLAPDQVVAPAQVMSKAMTNAEKLARDTRERDEALAAREDISAGRSGGGQPQGQVASAVTSAGHSCPTMRQIVPINAGMGIYRVVCSDPDGNNERAYRLDSRSGAVSPEQGAAAA